MPTLPPPPPDPSRDASRDAGLPVTRFGTLAGVGAAGAMACAFPAALHLAGALSPGESLGRVWIGLTVAALLPMIAVVAVLGRAREGRRAFAGPGAGSFAFGVVMWVVLLGFALALLGSALRATTHHHALAGVTFALCALALAAGLAAVCARFAGWLDALPPGPRRTIRIAVSVGMWAAAVWLALGCARAQSHDAASAAQVQTLLDVTAFLLAAALAARQALVVRRALALVGPPAVVVIFAVGVPVLRSEPFREVLSEKAPAFAVAAELLVPRR